MVLTAAASGDAALVIKWVQWPAVSWAASCCCCYLLSAPHSHPAGCFVPTLRMGVNSGVSVVVDSGSRC